MINTFQVNRLPNAIYIQFMDYIVAKVEDKDPANLKVQPQYNLLTEKLSEVRDLYKQAQASSLTEKIVEADNYRDQILTGIIRIVEGNTYHFDEETRESANLLYKNLQNLGSNIANGDYQTETANIDSIVTNWRTRNSLSTAVDKLLLNAWIAELEVANKEFKRFYSLRAEEYSKLPDEKMQKKRTEVNLAYEDLCKHLNSHSVLNKRPEYDSLIAAINVYVEQYKMLLKQKKSRAKSKEKDENEAE